jgi:hypothetical protein
MAWRKRRSVDITTSLPTGVPTYSKISSMVKQIINASQYDYHETEAFEVTEVILNEPGLRGSVRGSFINNPDQEILGGVVKPKEPGKLTVPVIGEHVDVIELNGQHFYTSIINRKGSVNENSIPGASGIYEKNTKYGETFERRDVKELEIGEGCTLFQGRFGQSIHFNGHDNKPSILIRNNIDRGNGSIVSENIDTDDSSIYLTSDGLRGKRFDNQQIEGKKVLIKSDGIFIKGSDIRLGTAVETDLQPVAKGDTVKEILDDIVDVLSQVLPIAIDNTQTPISTKNPALLTKINSLKTKTKNILSTKVKTQ